MLIFARRRWLVGIALLAVLGNGCILRSVSVETLQTTFDDHFSVITDLGEPGNELGERVIRFIKEKRARSSPAE